MRGDYQGILFWLAPDGQRIRVPWAHEDTALEILKTRFPEEAKNFDNSLDITTNNGYCKGFNFLINHGYCACRSDVNNQYYSAKELNSSIADLISSDIEKNYNGKKTVFVYANNDVVIEASEDAVLRYLSRF